MMSIDFLIGAIRASRDLHPQVKTELEEILNRQEPAKVNKVTVHDSILERYLVYDVCECGQILYPMKNFCPKCGKAMKWE